MVRGIFRLMSYFNLTPVIYISSFSWFILWGKVFLCFCDWTGKGQWHQRISQKQKFHNVPYWNMLFFPPFKRTNIRPSENTNDLLNLHYTAYSFHSMNFNIFLCVVCSNRWCVIWILRQLIEYVCIELFQCCSRLLKQSF